MLIITGIKVGGAPVAKRAALTGLPWTVEEIGKSRRRRWGLQKVRDNQSEK